MVEVDLDRLGQLAERATKGPWSSRTVRNLGCEDCDLNDAIDGSGYVTVVNVCAPYAGPGELPPNTTQLVAELGYVYEGAQSVRDAEYIAALSPDVVLALVEELEQAERTRQAHIQQVKALETKCANQAEAIQEQHRTITQRNKQLDAMNWVWCSGCCGPTLDEERVRLAIRNTDRMVEKFNGQQSSRKWQELRPYPDDQNALVTAWQHFRNEIDRRRAVERERDALVDELQALRAERDARAREGR